MTVIFAWRTIPYICYWENIGYHSLLIDETQQDPQLQALGEYIRYMKKLYNAFHKNTVIWEQRRQKLMSCKHFFNSRVKMLSKRQKDIISTIDNIVHLVDRVPDQISDTIRSCLGTIMVEVFFLLDESDVCHATFEKICCERNPQTF